MFGIAVMITTVVGSANFFAQAGYSRAASAGDKARLFYFTECNALNLTDL